MDKLCDTLGIQEEQKERLPRKKKEPMDGVGISYLFRKGRRNPWATSKMRKDGTFGTFLAMANL